MDNELLIVRGSTFEMTVLWEDRDVIVRKPITGISIATGAPVLEVVGHGMPAMWRGYVTLVEGMTSINADNIPPREKDFYDVTVLDADHVEFNKVDPVTDGRKWGAYTGGGFLNYYAVKDLTGHTARMKIKDRAGGTVLLSSEASDAPLDVIEIDVSPSLKRTKLTISAADSAGLAFSKGVADMEMVGPSGLVARVKLTSNGKIGDPDPVRVSGEITT